MPELVHRHQIWSDDDSYMLTNVGAMRTDSVTMLALSTSFAEVLGFAPRNTVSVYPKRCARFLAPSPNFAFVALFSG